MSLFQNEQGLRCDGTSPEVFPRGVEELHPTRVSYKQLGSAIAFSKLLSNSKGFMPFELVS